MTSSLLFSSEFKDEQLSYISSFIESLELKINELEELEKVNVYYISEGGKNDLADCITDILNKYQEQIVLIGSGFLFSNGLIVFTRFKGEKRLLPNAIGMIHVSGFLTHTRDLNRENTYDQTQQLQLEDVNKEIIKLFTPILTKEELNRVIANEEVYLSNKRLKQMFKIK